MDLRKLSTEQLKALKERTVSYFAGGLSVRQVLDRVDLDSPQLVTLRRRDQMFDHHIIIAIDKAEQAGNNVSKPKTA